MLPSLRRPAVSPALEAALANFERPGAESPTGWSRADCWGEMFAVSQATERQASSGGRRRFQTSPRGRQRLGPGLRAQPETIDLKPIGFLNPARRPIAQTGQHGLSLITKMQFAAAGPICSRVSTNETDEIKHEKAYISTKPSRMSSCSERALDSNRVLVIQRATRGRLASTRVLAHFCACRKQSRFYSMAKSLTGMGNRYCRRK